MDRRSFVLKTIGGATLLFPFTSKAKKNGLQLFGSDHLLKAEDFKNRDHFDLLTEAERIAFKNGKTLLLPKNQKIKITRPLKLRVSVDGQGSTFEFCSPDAGLKLNSSPEYGEIQVQDLKIVSTVKRESALIEYEGGGENFLIKRCHFREKSGCDTLIDIKSAKFVHISQSHFHFHSSRGISCKSTKKLFVDRNHLSYLGLHTENANFIVIDSIGDSAIEKNVLNLSTKTQSDKRWPSIVTLGGYRPLKMSGNSFS